MSKGGCKGRSWKRSCQKRELQRRAGPRAKLRRTGQAGQGSNERRDTCTRGIISSVGRTVAINVLSRLYHVVHCRA